MLRELLVRTHIHSILLILAIPLQLSFAQQAASLKEEEKCKPPEFPGELYASLWIQTSGEYRAICLQTFRQALETVRRTATSAPRIRTAAPVGPDSKPMAVVADLDETILDNSPYNVELQLQSEAAKRCFSEPTWNGWVKSNGKDTELVPGAGRFIQQVESLKVVMVYISNRPESLRNNTIKTLASLGVDVQGMESAQGLRLLLQTDQSAKASRQRLVSERYHIVAFLGDNLGDFPGDFGRTAASRSQRAEELDELWGTYWFVLPNPVYGTWERVLRENPIDHLRRASDKGFLNPAR